MQSWNQSPLSSLPLARLSGITANENKSIKDNNKKTETIIATFFDDANGAIISAGLEQSGYLLLWKSPKQRWNLRTNATMLVLNACLRPVFTTLDHAVYASTFQSSTRHTRTTLVCDPWILDTRDFDYHQYACMRIYLLKTRLTFFLE